MVADATQLNCTGDVMNNYLRAALPVAALIFIAPAANAWNLVNSINADARQMPGAPATTVVASGSAGA